MSKKHRFQTDVTPEQLGQLEALMTRSGVESKRDLFNNALTLLQWAVEHNRRGCEIASIDRNKKEIVTMLRLPIFQSNL
jgi:hypothetical protein